MNIFYFDEPIIAYCPSCDDEARYSMDEGLICKQCGTENLSIFKHDPNSKYPEN